MLGRGEAELGSSATRKIYKFKADKEIILTAVKQDGAALHLAADSCKMDREIVEAAVAQNWRVLYHAADVLLEDQDFAKEAKQLFYILKVTMMSSKCTFLLYPEDWASIAHTEDVLDECCRRLRLPRQGTEKLIHDCELVPACTPLRNFPGLLPLGEVTGLQLVV
mmetsp:Transcript_40784/g.73674  ORF Transcript_40784/g.73674 Transcript_40784/m.73674 type:complete len:165 (-) Transcript_40784:15-509(-)